MQLEEHIPLEQGLRPVIIWFNPLIHCLLEEPLPLKQGLRQRGEAGEGGDRGHLEEHIPLEQGLQKVAAGGRIIRELRIFAK